MAYYKVWFDEDDMPEVHAVNIWEDSREKAVKEALLYLKGIGETANFKFSYIQTPEGDFEFNHKDNAWVEREEV